MEVLNFHKKLSFQYLVWKKIKIYHFAILINIDNFNEFDTDAPILYFKARDQFGNVEHKLYNSIHIILENFRNPKYNIGKEITKFLEFITSSEFSDIKNVSKGDEDYMAAFRKVEDLSTDPEFIGYYDYEQAHQDDIEMAEYAGYEKGIEEMIINMKEEGLTLEMISKIAKLSIEEVNRILNN